MLRQLQDHLEYQVCACLLLGLPFHHDVAHQTVPHVFLCGLVMPQEGPLVAIIQVHG